ncbi:MAG: hypothetical protein CME65_05575 [Halobacteriovoraceae bacterium]|nr:hypothetical protein [Halobacteriovoraceae bacterium]|tara:strand:- start:4106 stop:5248 length:1143 start_codon:yes stop_codon:yes gene_type:complete
MINKSILVSLLWSLLLVSCGSDIKDTAPGDSSNSSSNGDALVSNEEVTAANKQKLYLALQSDDSNIVRIALQEQAHIDYLFENGESPLTYAIAENRSEIVFMIINKAKNFDIRESSGETPLIKAIKRNNILVLDLLIRKGADLELLDSNGVSPLYHALYRANEVIAINLLKNGAELRDQGAKSIRELATDFNLRRVSLLIPLIENHDQPRDSELIRAIRSGNVDYVNYLLINFEFYRMSIVERNVIIVAINIEDESTRISMVNALLDGGANPDNIEGVPALIAATEEEQLRTVELLLLYADPFILDDYNETALHYAVRSNNYMIVQKIYINMTTKVTSGASNANLEEITTSACAQRIRTRRLTSAQTIDRRNISSLLNCY